MPSDASTERNVAFLRRREQEELTRAKAASSSEDRIGHLALARAFARQIDRQRILPDADETPAYTMPIDKSQGED